METTFSRRERERERDPLTRETYLIFFSFFFFDVGANTQPDSRHGKFVTVLAQSSYYDLSL